MSSPKTSVGPKKKSGKRSAASSQPPPDPVTFYVDECLGRHVPGELTAAGYDVRPWYEHFAGRDDAEWLPAIGERAWVLLTKDKDIRRRPLEIEAILNARVRAFVLTATQLRREEQAAIFLRAMPKIHRICRRTGPFIFNITRMGHFAELSKRVLNRRAGRRSRR